ncbi:50S ribosomal protein L29 [Candidatus Binatia bacterium]|jgi:large subunit ribosomal protein L29|nr:50S ribosomal protein L29 [Candidatus Binatia bacterium]
MRLRELRELGDDELGQKERDFREEMFRLRLRGATGQIENKMKARMVRRDLARVLTLKRERATGAGR